MSNFSGVSRPARAAGIGLLAIAVAAAVIGGVTVLTSGDSENTAAPPTSTTSAAPKPPPGGSPPPGQPSPTTGTSPTTSSQPPTSTQPPTSQPGGPGGEPGPGQPGGPEDRQASAKWVSVRVYNNSTIKGLAHRAAADLRGQGWNVVETSNYSSGIIPTTTAYFRPGTDEESAAKALGSAFGMRVEPRFDGIAQSSPGVIVIVTRDYEQSAGKGK